MTKTQLIVVNQIKYGANILFYFDKSKLARVKTNLFGKATSTFIGYHFEDKEVLNNSNDNKNFRFIVGFNE